MHRFFINQKKMNNIFNMQLSKRDAIKSKSVFKKIFVKKYRIPAI